MFNNIIIFIKENFSFINFEVYLLISLLILIIVDCLNFKFKNRRLLQFAKQFPGPIALPFIGNGYIAFGQLHIVFKRYHKTVNNYYKPLPVRLWLGKKLFININKPEHLAVVLNSPNAFNKSFLYKFSKSWLNDGLLISTGLKYKRHRKIILRSFNQQILNQYADIFQMQAEKIVKQLETNAINGEIFDIRIFLKEYVLDTICETTMGSNKNGSKQNRTYWFFCVEKNIQIAFLRIINIWYHFDTIFQFTKLSRQVETCTKYLRQFTDDLIHSKRIECKENPHESSEQQRKPFLQMLIEDSNFTDQEIREEANTLIIAGNDTVLSATSMTLLELAMNPEIQEKVFMEICNAQLNNNNSINATDLNKLKYLDMVIKEVLRLYPTGALLSREITGDIQLDSCVIPKGCTVAVSLYSTHRNPIHWPEPDKFIPERFTPENSKDRHPYAYIPFSAGPRSCVGAHYGLMVIKCWIVNILRAYHVSTCLKRNELDLELQLILCLRQGCLIKIQKRQIK